MASYPDLRPEHLGRRHQHQGLQGDHEQEEQLPDPVARLPGRLRARVDVQGRLDAGRGQGRLLAERHLPLPVGLPIGGHVEDELRVRGVRHDRSCSGRSRSRATRSSTSSPTRLAERGRRSARAGRQGPVHRDGQGLRPRARRPGSTCRARRAAGSPTAREVRLLEGDPRPTRCKGAQTRPPGLATSSGCDKENCSAAGRHLPRR